MSVRRPQSMYVPRINTEDLSPRTQEAPATLAPTRSRPSASRINTFESARPPGALDAARTAFEQGAFAEPKKVRASLFDVGRALHTPAHVRTTEALRDECARLHQYAGHMRKQLGDSTERLSRLEGQRTHAYSEVERLKSRCRLLAETNLKLSADLKVATESLAEVDAMFLAASNKRMSRLSDAAAAQLAAPEMMALGEPLSRAHSQEGRSRD